MQAKPWQILSTTDPTVYALIERELKRQRSGLELIASENFASASVVAAAANVFTNKYAEGLPGKRYYGGCHVVDELEALAMERAKKLFGANFVNVQPHSGAQANAAVFLALLQPGDRILGLDLSHGGHLTHGAKVNFSGSIYESHFYQLDPATERLDYNRIEAAAKELKPKVIVAGASAYARTIDFAIFRMIADSVGATLVVDMAHIAGLVAAGLHPSPIPHAHVTTTTTHKTLRGPRGGLVMWNDEALTAKLNKGVFPGTQGGPLEHIIAAKAVCFLEAQSPAFATYQKAIVDNARALATKLVAQNMRLVTGGTDNHLMLLDLSETDVSGKQLEEALGKVEITVNKNTVPNEKRSPFVTSGIRIGTPAVTSRGMGQAEMATIAELIVRTFKAVAANRENELREIEVQVQGLAHRFPLYADWNA